MNFTSWLYTRKLNVHGQDLQASEGATWNAAHLLHTFWSKMWFITGSGWASWIQTSYWRKYLHINYCFYFPSIPSAPLLLLSLHFFYTSLIYIHNFYMCVTHIVHITVDYFKIYQQKLSRKWGNSISQEPETFLKYFLNINRSQEVFW